MPKSKFGISCACLGLAGVGAMLVGIALFLIFSGGNMGLELNGNIDRLSIPEPQLKIINKASSRWKVNSALLAALLEKESSFISGDINRDWTKVKSSANPPALGPAQFLQSTWDANTQTSYQRYDEKFDAGGNTYSQDQNGSPDGNDNIYSPWDAVYGAAYKLAMSGAGGNATPESNLNAIKNALSIYNSGKPWSQGKNIEQTKDYVDGNGKGGKKPGILVLYAQYSIDGVNISTCSANTLNQARLYQGTKRWKGQTGGSHCGNIDIVGPAGAPGGVDCSGFVSRIYSDLGLFGKDTQGQNKTLCLSTETIPNQDSLVEISASEIAPGDIIVKQGDDPHTMIYVSGNVNERFTVWESGGFGNGPVGLHSRKAKPNQRYFRSKICAN